MIKRYKSHYPAVRRVDPQYLEHPYAGLFDMTGGRLMLGYELAYHLHD